MSVPEGLAKCAVCGEYRGKVRAGDLGLGTRPASAEDSDELLGVSCICEGIECVLCHENKTHRPISNIYDERSNDICHVPHFSVLCGECKARRSAEAAAPEHTEPVLVETEQGEGQDEAQLIVLRPLVSCNGVLERAVAGGSLVYGIEPGSERLVLIPELHAHHRAALWRALTGSRTWGEFERSVHPAEYEFVLDRFRWQKGGSEEEIEVCMRSQAICREEALQWLGLPAPFPPADDDPFDLYEIPGVNEGQYPIYPTDEMRLWVPEDIAERYGYEIFQCPGNDYDGLDLKGEFEGEIVVRLRELGWECRKDGELVEAATYTEDAEGI